MNISYNSNTANLLNPRTRRRKFGVGSLLFLIIFGVAFFAIGMAVIKSSKIDPSWTRETGTVSGESTSVSNGSTTYNPIVTYKVNGQSYQVTAGSGSSSFPVNGSQKQIAYNPAQPAQAKVVDTAGTQALLYLFPVIGILVVVISVIAFIRSLRRSRDIGNLQQTGIKLPGIIVDIQSSAAAAGMQSNNSGSTYRIVVAAVGSNGTTQNYISDSLTGIGGLAMADFRSNPIPIDVYVNPSNPKDYYVDVSEVPNLTPERLRELIQSATATRNLVSGAPSAATPPTVPPQPPTQQPPTQPL